VGILWFPFGLRVGPDADVWNIHANPTQYPWFNPVLLRPFLFTTYRLSSFLFPESFVGYNLLVAACVFGKGLVMYMLLDRLLPERPAFAFLTAALLTVYPAGIFTFRANMVGYHFATLCYLAAVFLLVVYRDRPRAWVLGSMYAALALGLGTFETLLPLVLFTPILLVLMEGGISRRVLRTSLLWLLIPTVLTIYLAFALLTKAGNAAYQSSRLNVPAHGLAAALADSLVHVYRQHFWMGYRTGLERLVGSAAPTSHRLLALAAAAIVGAIGGTLY